MNYAKKEILKGETMKKYTSPTIVLTSVSAEDILTGSDVLIDGSDLFGEEN